MSRLMKNSGIEWLQEIPQEWKLYPLGVFLKERKEKVSDLEYTPLSVTKKGIVLQLENAAKSDAHDDRKKVCRNDFVINSRSDRKQSCGLSSYNGSVSLINIVLNITKYNPNYINYLLNNCMFAEEFYSQGHGIVADLWTTRYSEMSKIVLPFPSLNEQEKIADYLDKKVSKIDETIENNKKSIELLEEYRNRLINSIFVSSRFPRKKIKYCVKLRNEKGKVTEKDTYIGLENIESFTTKYIKLDNNYTDADGKIFKKGDLLINKLRPYLAKSYVAEFDGICTGEVEVIKEFDGDINYLKYFTISEKYIDMVNSSTYGTKMPRANWNFIKNILIPMPSTLEQNKIVNKLDNKIEKIISVIDYRKQIIEKLEEYKKSLIYEAVTGKIEA